MKYIITTCIALLILIAACHPAKKSTNTTAAIPSAKATPDLTPAEMAKKRSGIYPPGDNELAAIQPTHKEVTLEILTEGYKIYTGQCTNCHGAVGIYEINPDRWSFIIDDMAGRSKLTGLQKDAVYKYVLAIKAAKPK